MVNGRLISPWSYVELAGSPRSLVNAPACAGREAGTPDHLQRMDCRDPDSL